MVVLCDLKNWATGEGDCQSNRQRHVGATCNCNCNLDSWIMQTLAKCRHTQFVSLTVFPAVFFSVFLCCGQTNKLFVIIAGWHWPPDRVKNISGLGVKLESKMETKTETESESELRVRLEREAANCQRRRSWQQFA